jgi:hypothetical protein
MKPVRRPARLALERLESRDCPSLAVTLFGGSLTVRGTPLGALSINEPSPGGRLTVTDNGHSLGTYAVGGDLRLNLASHPNTVTVDLGGNTFAGSVLISLGNGDPAGDLVAVQNGTVGGNVTFLGGSGREAESVGRPTLFAVPLTVRGNVEAVGKVSGGGALGPRNALLLGPGSTVGGDVTAVQFGFVAVGQQGRALTAVGGNLNVNDSGSGAPLRVNLFGDVGKSVSVTGTALQDAFFLQPAGPGVGGNVGGDLSVDLGPGGEGGDIFGVGPDMVGGNTTLTTLGTPNVFPPGGFIVAGTFDGSLTVKMGEGANFFAFDQASVGGNLSVTGGNGNDSATLHGTVGGDLSFHFGNGGAVAVTVFTAPAALLRWASGNGNDVLTLAPTASGTGWNVDVRFGSGEGSFTLAGAGGFISGTVNGGGTNVFTQGAGWVIVPPWTLQNF